MCYTSYRFQVSGLFLMIFDTDVDEFSAVRHKILVEKK